MDKQEVVKVATAVESVGHARVRLVCESLAARGIKVSPLVMLEAFCNADAQQPSQSLVREVIKAARKACDHWDANCDRGDPPYLNMATPLRGLRATLTTFDDYEDLTIGDYEQGWNAYHYSLQASIAKLPRYEMRDERVTLELPSGPYSSHVATESTTITTLEQTPRGEYIKLADIEATEFTHPVLVIDDAMVTRAEDYYYDNSPFNGPVEFREGIRQMLIAAHQTREEDE